MAGWKLRKDKAQEKAQEKTQAETPGAEPQTAAEPIAAEPIATGHGAEIYSAPASGDEHSAAFLDPGSEPSSAPGQYTPSSNLETGDLETGGDLHFEDEDSPLKLMDYSAPFTQDLLPLSAAPIIAAPPPVETTPAETPTLETPILETPSFDTSTPEPAAPTGDFTSTLRMNREELAAFAPASPAGIPPVPPFVLDAPLVSPATEETPPRLVLRVGRLSAAFDLTKKVTTIGRPDSEMHYYPDVEIDLDDAVSRRHAEIIKQGDGYSLVDTGSTNGTLLNGEKLPAHEERLLTHGDRIRVGERTEIIFE